MNTCMQTENSRKSQTVIVPLLCLQLKEHIKEIINACVLVSIEYKNCSFNLSTASVKVGNHIDKSWTL